MKVIFHHDFYQQYSSDPAASSGRMEAVIDAITSNVDIINATICIITEEMEEQSK